MNLAAGCSSLLELSGKARHSIWKLRNHKTFRVRALSEHNVKEVQSDWKSGD